jgi:enoyl-CoA hydratase
MDNPFGPELLLEDRGNGVRLVTLNRPEFENATNERLHGAIIGVWRHIANDPKARAVVLTGAGKAFSAGGDMEHFIEVQNDLVLRRREIEGARRLVSAML